MNAGLQLGFLMDNIAENADLVSEDAPRISEWIRRKLWKTAAYCRERRSKFRQGLCRTPAVFRAAPLESQANQFEILCFFHAERFPDRFMTLPGVQFFGVGASFLCDISLHRFS